MSWKAVPPKRWLSNKMLAGGLLLAFVYSAFENRKARRRMANVEVGNYDARIAMEPFIEAERDRRFLIMLHNNRELEKKIMADVPGWVPGTLYGRPYFQSLDKDKLIPELMGTFNMFTRERWYREADPTRQGLAEWKLLD